MTTYRTIICLKTRRLLGRARPDVSYAPVMERDGAGIAAQSQFAVAAGMTYRTVNEALKVAREYALRDMESRGVKGGLPAWRLVDRAEREHPYRLEFVAETGGGEPGPQPDEERLQREAQRLWDEMPPDRTTEVVRYSAADYPTTKLLVGFADPGEYMREYGARDERETFTFTYQEDGERLGVHRYRWDGEDYRPYDGTRK